MNWLILALLSPAIYTVINFTDKYLVSSVVKDYRAMPIYTTIVGFIAGFFFWIVTGFPTLGFRDGIIITFTGMLTIWAALLYFQALSEEETTTVIIFFQMLPVFSLILSYFILGELITIKQFIGFIFILSAAIGVSLKRTKKKKVHIAKSLLLITMFNIMWAVAGVLVKFTINANSFSTILSYESWGIGIGGLILFLFYKPVKKAFLENIKTVKKRTLSILFINEFVFVIAKSLSFLAYSLGPVALVSVLGSSQVFYGILYGFILALVFPRVFKEEGDRTNLLRKIVLSIVLFIGIVLVY